MTEYRVDILEYRSAEFMQPEELTESQGHMG